MATPLKYSEKIIIDDLNLWVQIKDLKALKKMGVDSSAMLCESGIEGAFIQIYRIEFDDTTTKFDKGIQRSGYHFREGDGSDNFRNRSMRVPVECCEFDFEAFVDTNAEYFV